MHDDVIEHFSEPCTHGRIEVDGVKGWRYKLRRECPECVAEIREKAGMLPEVRYWRGE